MKNKTFNFAFFAAFLCFIAISSYAQVPTTLNYQALLTDAEGELVADGTYQVTFLIYDSQTGGQPLWTEVDQVAVINGVFSIVLGKNNPINIDFDKRYWLGLKISTGSELAPRTEMTSTAYAQMAKTAEKLSPDANGVVKSINSIEGAVVLEGGGGTTINKSGQTITITSSGGGGTGIQGVQNTDGNLTITNPNGPTATINLSTSASMKPSGDAGGDLSGTYPNPSIKDDGVSTAKIADGAVTDQKIADVAWSKITAAPTDFPPSGPAGGDLSGTYPTPTIGTGKVTTDKIADTAVTNAKIKDVAWTKITGAPGTGATNIDGLSDGKTDTTSVFLGLNSGNSDDGNNGNTAAGIDALKSNNSGQNNSAFGRNALAGNTTGYSNVAIGFHALKSNTSNSNLVAIGDSSLCKNGTGASGDWFAMYNTGVGSKTLTNNTFGYSNTALAYYALYNNISGNANTAIGSNSLTNNTRGSENTAVGTESMHYNLTGSENSALGAFSLKYNKSGFYNVALGTQALSRDTSGSSNIAIGYRALYFNNNKSNLVAIGDSALYYNDGYYNTAVGSKALYSNSTGSQNTATGYNSMLANTKGNDNVAYGSYSLAKSDTAIFNSAFGSWALYNNTKGNSNTAIGLNALRNNTIGSYNTALGASTYMATSNYTNSTAIGSQAEVDGSNKVRIGNTSVAVIGGQVAWTSYSDGRFKTDVEEDIPGLTFVTKLRPVTYHWDLKSLNRQVYGDRVIPDWEGKYDIEKIKFSGFIAQEVQSTAKEVGYDFSGVDASGNVMGLRYSEFIPSIVKSIQEQQAMIESQRKEIEELRNLVMQLQSKLDGGVK